MFRRSYASVYDGDERWQGIKVPAGKVYAWDGESTYVKNPPYFEGMTMQPAAVGEIRGARVLALLGDSVTTDHISPAGNIAQGSPAAQYLVAQGVQPRDFNSVRRAPRQSRGHDARHLRQYPPAQSAGCPAPKAASPPTCRAAKR